MNKYKPVTPAKKYSYPAAHPQPHISTPGSRGQLPTDFKQELRSHYQARENLKIAYQAEKDARLFAESQLKEIMRRLEDADARNQRLEGDVQKYRDKYRRLKEKRGRSAEKGDNMGAREQQREFDKERQVFIHQQQLLKETMAQMEYELRNYDAIKQEEIKQVLRESELETKKLRTSEERLQGDLRALGAVKSAIEKELQFAYGQIKEKQRHIHALQGSLEDFQRQQIKIQQGIVLAQQQMQRLRAENSRLKCSLLKNQELFQESLAREAQQAQRRFSELLGEVEALREKNRSRENELRQVKYGQQRRQSLSDYGDVKRTCGLIKRHKE